MQTAHLDGAPDTPLQSPYPGLPCGETEGTNHRIEAARIESKIFRVALVKFDVRIAAPRLRDHIRRKIDSDCVRAARIGAGRDVSRSRSDVEHAHTSANVGCIKKWPDRADGNLPAKSVIISRLRPPTLALKLLKACCASKFVLRHARYPYC